MRQVLNIAARGKGNKEVIKETKETMQTRLG